MAWLESSRGLPPGVIPDPSDEWDWPVPFETMVTIPDGTGTWIFLDPTSSLIRAPLEELFFDLWSSLDIQYRGL